VREHFSEREMVDLTLAIGTINTWNRLSVGFRKTLPA
jgi:alkylhydroperoxidase family enzyme